jgi:calcium-dependent protein kinase|tara:strand:- start:161 stop:1039 length:879 start_codon:yes stop_codon:yes gene_type:complete
MGNICCQNKVRDLNIKNTIFIKKGFDISIYDPIVLGNGISGISYKLNINNKLLTCKKVKKSHFNMAYNEIEILREIYDKKYLPVFFNTIQTPKYLYIMYDYLDGVDLLQMIQTPTFDIREKETLANITKEITNGLYALFKHNYVHLDIKLENIIIKKTKPVQIKIIDLAYCKKINGKTNILEPIGTYGYASPEVLIYKRFFHNTDIWSLGVVLFSIITNHPLFTNTKNCNKAIKEINNFQNIYDMSIYLKNVDTDLIDLMDKMLKKTPAYRLSIKDVLDHKFITKNSTSLTQ